MRRFLLFLMCFLFSMHSAIADEYSDLRPGFASSLAPEGIGLYASPSLKDNKPLRQIGPGVSIYQPSAEGVALSDVGFAQLSSYLLPITSYPNGTSVAVLGVTPENWCHVMIDGRTGYIHHSKLQPLISYKQ